MAKASSDILSLLQENLQRHRLPEAVQLPANLHPAVSSGTIVAIANDISGAVIYLSISTALVKYIRQ